MESRRIDKVFVSRQYTQFLAGGRVPQLRGLVAAARGEGLSVRAEGRTCGGSVGSGERAPQPAAGPVPQAHRAVVSRGGDELAVRAKGDSPDTPPVLEPAVAEDGDELRQGFGWVAVAGDR